jgi:ribosome biogenesis protein YTM1
MRSGAAGAQAKRAFSSHTDWVTAAAWHPDSPHHLATASFDRTVKLWDLRALVPLHTLAAHTDKALAVAWAGPARLASGGADCALRMFAVTLAGP